ncbi:Tyrosine-protein phosphatase non-receptor type 9 [Balamuthia mandrillaris]
MQAVPNEKVHHEEVSDEQFRSLLTPKEAEALDEMKAKGPELCEGFRDAFLARFLFARKLDTDRALTLLRNHREWREKYFIDQFNVEEVADMLQTGFVQWVPGTRDRQGRGVNFIFPAKFELSFLQDCKKYLWFTYYMGDIIFDHSIDYMREGCLLIQDFTNASFNDLVHMAGGGGNAEMKHLTRELQDHVPGRFPGVLLVNAPWYVRWLIRLVKASGIVKEKLINRVRVVTLEELKEYVDEDNLLKELGGNLEFDHLEWLQKTMAAQPTPGEGRFMSLSPSVIQKRKEEAESKLQQEEASTTDEEQEDQQEKKKQKKKRNKHKKKHKKKNKKKDAEEGSD